MNVECHWPNKENNKKSTPSIIDYSVWWLTSKQLKNKTSRWKVYIVKKALNGRVTRSSPGILKWREVGDGTGLEKFKIDMN